MSALAALQAATKGHADPSPVPAAPTAPAAPRSALDDLRAATVSAKATPKPNAIQRQASKAVAGAVAAATAAGGMAGGKPLTDHDRYLREKARRNAGYVPPSTTVAQDLQNLSGQATEAIPNLVKGGLDTISTGLGNGPIDPSLYDNDAPLFSDMGLSRFSGKLVNFGQYVLPGANLVPAIGGAVGLGTGAVTDPVGTAKGLVESLDFRAPGLTPDERFFRLANLGLTALGTYHVGKAGAGAISDGAAAKRLVSEYGLDPGEAKQAVKAGRTAQVQQEARAARDSSLRGTDVKGQPTKAVDPLRRFAPAAATAAPETPAKIEPKTRFELTNVYEGDPTDPVEFARKYVDKANHPQAGGSGTTLRRASIPVPVSETQIELAKRHGLDLSNSKRQLDNFSVLHAEKKHGPSSTALSRGEAEVTPEDYAYLHDVLSDPDRVVYFDPRGPQEPARFGLYKRINGHALYVEEARGKNAKLAMVSFRKWPAASDPPEGFFGDYSDTSETVRGSTPPDSTAPEGPRFPPDDEPPAPPAKPGPSAPTGGGAPAMPEPAKADSPRIVGLSNEAQAARVTSGEIKLPEKGEAMSAEAIHKAGESLGSIEEAEGLARGIADKSVPLTGENFGKATKGAQLFEKGVADARERWKAARGTDGEADAKAALDAAADREQRFLNDIQKGKTEWSNVGRALQEGRQIDTGDFSDVYAAARRRKGGDVDPERADLFEGLSRQVAEKDARIAELEAERAKPEAPPAEDAEANVQRRSRRGSRRTKDEIRADRSDAWRAFRDANRAKGERPEGEVHLNSGLRPSDVLTREEWEALKRVAHSYVEEGAATLGDVLDRFRSDSEESGLHVLPDGHDGSGLPEGADAIHERAVVEALAKNHDERARSEGEARARLRKVQAQAQATDDIHRILDGTYEVGGRKATSDEAVKAIRDVRDRLKREAGMDGRSVDAEARLHKALLQATEDLLYGPEAKAQAAPDTPEAAAIRKKLEDTRARVKAKHGEQPPEREARTIAALEAQYAKARAQIDGNYRDLNARPLPKALEPERVKAARERLRDAKGVLDVRDRVESLADQVRRKDFSEFKAETAKRAADRETSEARRDKDLQRLRVERDALHKRVLSEIEAEGRTLPQKIVRGAVDLANIPRALKTTWDLSAPLRQGLVLSVAHPGKAAHAFVEQLRAFKDPVHAHAVNKAILEGPNADLYRKAGLYLSDAESGGISAHEEAFVSRIAGKVPGVAASERAYTTYLNVLRAGVFDGYVGGRSLPEADLKAFANFVNAATGRGKLGAFERSANGLAQAFFSPRYLASRFQLLAGEPLYAGGSAATKAAIAADMAKYVAVVAGTVAIAKAAGADVNLDPTSSDFMKIRIGNTRIDMMAGIQQALVFVVREVLGKRTSSTGNVKDLANPKYGGETRAGLAGEFLRSKLSPSAGYVANYLNGEKDPMGRKVDGADTLKDFLTPTIANDFYESVQEQGLPKGTALTIAAALGLGVNNQPPKEKAPPQMYDFLGERFGVVK